MTRSLPFKAVISGGVAFGALCAGAGIAHAQFKQTDLVSDIPGLATVTDSNLKTRGVFRSCPAVPSGLRTRPQIRPRFFRWWAAQAPPPLRSLSTSRPREAQARPGRSGMRGLVFPS